MKPHHCDLVMTVLIHVSRVLHKLMSFLLPNPPPTLRFAVLFVTSIWFVSVFFPLPVENIKGGVTETYLATDETPPSLSTKSPADPTMIFYSMDYGKRGKLSSVNNGMHLLRVQFNPWKWLISQQSIKTVCVSQFKCDCSTTRWSYMNEKQFMVGVL